MSSNSLNDDSPSLSMWWSFRDPSNAPKDISNRSKVVLYSAENRTIHVVLARDFDLRSGHIEITVPTVKPGKYIITRK